MYSTVEGEVLSGQQLNSDYWWRNIRCPVQFYPSMKHLLKDGYKQIIEISTQPILAHYVKQIALQDNLKDQETPVVMATLPCRRVPVKDQHKCFLQNTVCKLYTMGFPVDWTCVQSNPSATFVRSLTYPWLENNFWYRERPPQTIIPPLGTNKRTKKQTHPFLGQLKMTDPYSGLHCWETEIDLHRFPNLKDHALIQGGAIMPGAAYLEMAFAMVKDTFVDVAGLELCDVKLLSLLTLPETQVRSLRLRLLKTDKIDEATFHITSVQDDQSEIQLSSGSVSIDLLHRQKNYDDEACNQVGPVVNELMTNMTKMPMERFRQVREMFGFTYGPAFSIIKEIWQCNNEALCLVDISESLSIQTEAEGYVVHPCILDACLQSCFVPHESLATDDMSAVPVGFKSITLYDVPSTNQLYCHVTADVTDLEKYEVSLMSPSGKVLLTMCEFCSTELTRSPRQLAFAELAYEVQWMEDELQVQTGEPAPNLTCVLLKDSSDFSDALVTRLHAAKAKVITVDLPNDRCYNIKAQEAIDSAFVDILPNNSSNLRVINMWPVETTLLPDTFSVIDQAQRLAFSSSVFLLKLLMAKECLDSRLFLVTESTQVLGSSDKSPKTNSIPWGSTVWGLRRTANVEEFNLRVTTVDLNDKRDMHDVDSLVDEILCESIENEVAFREGKRFINRLLRSDVYQKQTTITNRTESNKRNSLYISTIPSSGKLCLREQSLSKPSHSELTLELLYFWTPSGSLIDVSKPKGCVFVVGKVTDLPEKSEPGTLQIGDEVCGVIASGRVSSSISIQASNAFVKPASLTRQQATCIPACLAIASHALQRVASGDEKLKLLIHEANRGPGPAAVVLATTLGHRVFCTIPDTCQTSTKTLLLELGAESVKRRSSSSISGGEFNDPFDAILFFYPPSPNALHKSSRGIKRGGRVILLSSQFHGDVVFPANTNIKYEREDIADIFRTPLVFEKLSSESLEMLEGKGVLGKLLVMQLESFDVYTSLKAANECTDKLSPREVPFVIHSFASLEEENHLQNIQVLPRGLDECGLKENRTYLVAGEWEDLDLKWRVGWRRMEQDAKCQQVREIEKRTGSKIHTFQIDISNQEQMSAFNEQLQSLPSVAGIVHSAMVLRDEFIKDLTYESFSEVMAPKIKGSFLLHQMSLEMDLDFFVMFSSIASIVGGMKQSSYSACNAFQDSLAQYRRHVLGLPGLAINWGPISGAGVMERETGVAKLMTMLGLGFINAKEGVKHMAKVLTEEPSRCQISLFDVDWPRFIKSNDRLRKTPRLFTILVETNAFDNQTSSSESLAQRIILEKESEKRAELVNEYVAISVTECAGISSPSETDLNKSLYSYGVDSTAALTLKMQLETNLQVSFEVFYFMQPDTTPLKMARDIAAKLNGPSSNSQLSSEQPKNSENQENEAAQTQPMADTSPTVITSGSQIQVVPLYTPAGSAIKFFCVHPSHRYALSLVPISTGFQGQDLVSFYALGFTDPTAVSEDWGGVRELAAHYVQLISKEQRHGPYFLGGYSYGGLLAYEMACLLTEQNQRVEFVAMIDTFPWSPLSWTVSTRLATMQEDGNSQRRLVELQFENYLKKLALDSLKMSADEYRQLREEHNQDWVIDELQRRSLEKGLAAFNNLRFLRESLLKDQTIASKTHQEWQPPEFAIEVLLHSSKAKTRASHPGFAHQIALRKYGTSW
ncbi:hypothetical protein OS493_013722 [Desmophyllum pertusum]|uniref:oleoyl-[acyl-carrier-protein] hydrolase n=1 Tax=Desmophyllum pertusum TaxID=174260 RepID=A0A9X0D5K8_9CNID|nr:hypothetical protein OS493_013722 [Desmophyllum pertusum]